MITYLDIQQTIQDILPPSQRLQNVAELLNVWLINTKNRNLEFNNYQYYTYQNLSIIPQTMVVEYLLNTQINLSGGSITITDAGQSTEKYIYNRSEYNPNPQTIYDRNNDSGNTSTMFIYDRIEQKNYNFSVSIPVQYSGDTNILNQIDKLVAANSPIGTKYNHIYYNTTPQYIAPTPTATTITLSAWANPYGFFQVFTYDIGAQTLSAFTNYSGGHSYPYTYSNTIATGSTSGDIYNLKFTVPDLSISGGNWAMWICQQGSVSTPICNIPTISTGSNNLNFTITSNSAIPIELVIDANPSYYTGVAGGTFTNFVLTKTH